VHAIETSSRIRGQMDLVALVLQYRPQQGESVAVIIDEQDLALHVHARFPGHVSSALFWPTKPDNPLDAAFVAQLGVGRRYLLACPFGRVAVRCTSRYASLLLVPSSFARTLRAAFSSRSWSRMMTASRSAGRDVSGTDWERVSPPPTSSVISP